VITKRDDIEKKFCARDININWWRNLM